MPSFGTEQLLRLIGPENVLNAAFCVSDAIDLASWTKKPSIRDQLKTVKQLLKNPRRFAWKALDWGKTGVVLVEDTKKKNWLMFAYHATPFSSCVDYVDSTALWAPKGAIRQAALDAYATEATIMQEMWQAVTKDPFGLRIWNAWFQQFEASWPVASAATLQGGTVHVQTFETKPTTANVRLSSRTYRWKGRLRPGFSEVRLRVGRAFRPGRHQLIITLRRGRRQWTYRTLVSVRRVTKSTRPHTP